MHVSTPIERPVTLVPRANPDFSRFYLQDDRPNTTSFSLSPDEFAALAHQMMELNERAIEYRAGRIARASA